MALTAEETVTYTERLEEAETALHRLMTGNAARVYVDQNGERVEYFKADSAKLRAYIYELKLALGKIEPGRPLNYWMR